MKFSRIWLICTLLFVGSTLTACSSSQQSNLADETVDVSTSQEPTLDALAKYKFTQQVSTYIGKGCKPVYSTDVTDFGDGVITRIKNMDVNYLSDSPYGLNGELVDVSYLLENNPEDVNLGNFATRTLMLSAYYYNELSYIYSYIFDIHAAELKSFKKDYLRFQSIADKSAKALCKVTERNLVSATFSENDLKLISEVHEVLSQNWGVLTQWNEAAYGYEQAVSRSIANEVEELTTPQCKEYPTNNSDYVIVKCTNLP